ncbi:hypothetical protein J2T18_001995 [Paenibacillus polymyxa]|uniref:hypothetical protein n=1 Tax=Paenibacillus polymyxa TaxID=1406 RepID=UPI00278D6E7D|nr:hypothetical protein [Paenibacillus polymyxa]MDQ0047712.1 hypothetical protein [Paenibacillus polymyxa]
MHIEFITSDSTDKLRAACYEYNYKKYGSVQRDRRYVRISTEEQTCKIIWKDHRLKLLTNDDVTKYLIMIFREFLRDMLSKTIMATGV